MQQNYLTPTPLHYAAELFDSHPAALYSRTI
jgi:hypothetical protein